MGLAAGDVVKDGGEVAFGFGVFGGFEAFFLEELADGVGVFIEAGAAGAVIWVGAVVLQD